MSIILRSGKGSALTYDELDGNLEQFYISSSLANDRTLSLFTSGGVDTITFPAADTLQSVTDIGSTTTNSITALSFIKTGGTSNDILLGDGTVTSLSALGSAIDTGSFYLSSSVALNTITFTQGDGTTEAVTVDTGSSSTSLYESATVNSIQSAYGTNSAAAPFATIAGGDNNAITSAGPNSFIGAGDSNTISADYCFIGAGITNIASANYATIAGGRGNSASGTVSSVTGGYLNLASGDYTIVGGGYLNTASADYATIAGGRKNLVSGLYNTIAGGRDNTATATYATIAGGNGNSTTNNGFVGGGASNIAGSGYSVVGGGRNNSAVSSYSIVVGGAYNRANTTYSAILAGSGSQAKGEYSTIVGGKNNIVDVNGIKSSIVAGSDNSISASGSVILAGEDNEIASTHHHSSILAGNNVTTTRAETAFAPSFFASGSTASTGIEGVMQMTRRTAFPTGTDEELAGMLVWKGAASGNHLYFAKLESGTLTWEQLT